MLLFIRIIASAAPVYDDFNTSHVTVYLSTIVLTAPLAIFQYISCYCLSRWKENTMQNKWISIHLMLLFISRWMVLCRFESLISIHLMLLFISRDFEQCGVSYEFQYISCYCLSRRHLEKTLQQLHFNTSHVTVYPLSNALL